MFLLQHYICFFHGGVEVCHGWGRSEEQSRSATDWPHWHGQCSLFSDGWKLGQKITKTHQSSQKKQVWIMGIKLQGCVWFIVSWIMVRSLLIRWVWYELLVPNQGGSDVGDAWWVLFPPSSISNLLKVQCLFESSMIILFWSIVRSPGSVAIDPNTLLKDKAWGIEDVSTNHPTTQQLCFESLSLRCPPPLVSMK